MRGWKTYLFIFTIITASCLCLSVSAQYDGTASVEPQAQSVTVGGSFSVEIWIRQLPFAMEFFGVDLEWDPGMVKYVGYTEHYPNPQWSILVDTTMVNSGALNLTVSDSVGQNWTSDYNWLTIDFECVHAGYSEIIIPDNVWLDASGFTHGFAPLNGSVLQIGNQVGGEVASVDVLALLAPWVTLAAVAATVAIGATVLLRRWVFIH